MNIAQMCALIQQNSHLLGVICKTHYEHETCKQTQKQMRYYAVLPQTTDIPRFNVHVCRAVLMMFTNIKPKQK